MGALALSSMLLLGACSSSEGAEDTGDDKTAADAAVVEIDTFVFTPKTITVPVGTEVTWNNGDDILHTATSGKQVKQGVPGVAKDKAAQPDGTFDLQMDGEGTSASFTFEEAGTYLYFCTVHAAMTGRVVVE